MAIDYSKWDWDSIVKTGDKVTHVDKTWESNMDGNVWEPADDSLQWDEVQ